MIERISNVIVEVDQYQSSIAGAVQLQTATTNDITQRITDVSHSISSMEDQVGGMEVASQTWLAELSKVDAISRDLSTQAAELHHLAEGFQLKR